MARAAWTDAECVRVPAAVAPVVNPHSNAGGATFDLHLYPMNMIECFDSSDFIPLDSGV